MLSESVFDNLDVIKIEAKNPSQIELNPTDNGKEILKAEAGNIYIL
jgi:hypothetical protein